MYNKIYEILEEKGRIKTAIILDGPDMGKKCIVRQPGNPDAAAQEKSLIPEQEEDREIWEKYLPLLNDARETKVITAHVSQPTAHLGKMLGFHVTIMDDREDFVTKERFPEADELVYGDFKDLDQYIVPYENAYYVILTRGHLGDADCLRRLLKRPYEYLGMIGSKNKVRITRENLLKEGYSLEELKLVAGLHEIVGRT